MRFTPGAFLMDGDSKRTITAALMPAEIKVTGTVIQVNPAHRWARVRWETEKGPLFECFKF